MFAFANMKGHLFVTDYVIRIMLSIIKGAFMFQKNNNVSMENLPKLKKNNILKEEFSQDSIIKEICASSIR
jgi:hypothetical protein